MRVVWAAATKVLRHSNRHQTVGALARATIVHQSLIVVFRLVEIPFRCHWHHVPIAVGREILIGIIALFQQQARLIEPRSFVVVQLTGGRKAVAGEMAVEIDGAARQGRLQ